MKAWTVVPIVLAAATVGFVAGRVAGTSPASDTVSRARAEKAERERDEALAGLEAARAALAAERRNRPAAGPATDGGSAEGDFAPVAGQTSGTPASEALPRDSAARTESVRVLAARIDEAFETRDGDLALEILRKLAALVPEGGPAAMDLAVRINADLYGEGVLRLDQYGFYGSLGDTDMRALMLWSFEHESPADFRVLAAASLPWVLPREKAGDVLLGALEREKAVPVQAALVAALAQMNDSRVEGALARTLADGQRDAGVRAQIATALALSSNADAESAIRIAAASAAEESVRAAARAALTARDPPVDGFLVTFVFPEGAAAGAGVRPGDILVSYDGKPTRDLKELRALMEAGGAGSVPLVVLRDGAERPLEVRRGRLGVQGRPVRRR